MRRLSSYQRSATRLIRAASILNTLGAPTALMEVNFAQHYEQSFQLRANLTEYFSLDELESLCFDVGIDKDNIPGKAKGKDYFITELLSYVQRRELIPRLLIVCCQTRPKANWEDVITEALQPPEPHVLPPRTSFIKRLVGMWKIALSLILVAMGIGLFLSLISQPRTFSSNHSSRLYFDQNGDRINLEVCADNLPGQTVFARLARPSRTFDVLSQRASERCTTFWDMDGDGPALSNITYTTKAALNQSPNDTWSAPCYEATGGQGLCDSAQYSFDVDSISIESMPMKVIYYYSGVGDPKNGNTGGGLSVVYNENSHADYRLNYALPDEGEGYVGLAFLFSKTQDLADYKFVEVKINFEDENTYCLLFIKDNTKTLEDSVPLKLGIPLQPDIGVSISGREQTLKIPLNTNFQHVNPKNVTEVDVDCDANITRGNRTFTVTGIKFLKS